MMNFHRWVPRAIERAGFSAIELLFVVAVTGILIATALPSLAPAVAGARLSGDGHTLAYQVAVAKMRSASYFTRARLFADLASNTYRVEVWQKEGAPGWVIEGADQYLSRGIRFGFDGLGAPPPNTQTAIAQAAPCLDDAGAAIGNTSCVVFNSRGVPIDATGTPVGSDALYITDGSAVYGTTIAATGLSRLWWAPLGTGTWQKQ